MLIKAKEHCGSVPEIKERNRGKSTYLTPYAIQVQNLWPFIINMRRLGPFSPIDFHVVIPSPRSVPSQKRTAGT